MSNQSMQCGNNLEYIYTYGKLSVCPINPENPGGEMWPDCPPPENWNVDSLHISVGVTAIGDNAFSDMPLTSVYLPDSLVTIGANAFKNCEELYEIEIPDKVETIGEGAFQNTGISSVEIPGSVETIEKGAFMYCQNLTDVNVNAKNIGEYAFFASEIETLNIGKKVKSIGDAAFADNNIQGKVSLTGVIDIGCNSFEGQNDAEFIANSNICPILQEEGLNAREPSLAELIDEAQEESKAYNDSFGGIEVEQPQPESIAI